MVENLIKTDHQRDPALIYSYEIGRSAKPVPAGLKKFIKLLIAAIITELILQMLH